MQRDAGATDASGRRVCRVARGCPHRGTRGNGGIPVRTSVAVANRKIMHCECVVKMDRLFFLVVFVVRAWHGKQIK